MMDVGCGGGPAPGRGTRHWTAPCASPPRVCPPPPAPAAWSRAAGGTGERWGPHLCGGAQWLWRRMPKDPPKDLNVYVDVLLFWHTWYHQPTMVTRSLGALASSSRSMATSSSSRFTAMPGKGVRIGGDGRNLASLMELFNATYREPHVAPDIPPGDRRGRQADRPGRRRSRRRDQPRARRAGEIRSNLAVGGTAASDRADRHASAKSALPSVPS